MSGIRGRNTRIEVAVRKALFARGFRYRLNDKSLPGKPDMVFPRYRALVFVHGCYWHGHDCTLFRLPASNQEFWQTKIDGNRARDARNISALNSLGWRIGVVWECALRNKGPKGLEIVANRLSAWLKEQEQTESIGIKG